MTKKLELPKLNKKFKKKWVDALRSGKYAQTDAYLYNRHVDGYCCLGVACKVMGIDVKELSNQSYPDDDALVKMGFDPDKHIERSADACAQNNHIVNKLASFNDEDGWSFNKIAAYIDRYL